MLSARQDRDTAVLMLVYNGNCDLTMQYTFDYVQVSYIHNMGRDERKPVFGVCDKVRFKPVYSATGTS